jgi:hypothetical protein
MSGAFDGLRKQALMRRADAADSPWKYLPPLGNKVTEEFLVFEIDIGDFLRAEFAYSLAPDTEPFWTWHIEWPFYRRKPGFRLSLSAVKFLHICFH